LKILNNSKLDPNTRTSFTSYVTTNVAGLSYQYLKLQKENQAQASTEFKVKSAKRIKGYHARIQQATMDRFLKRIIVGTFPHLNFTKFAYVRIW